MGLEGSCALVVRMLLAVCMGILLWLGGTIYLYVASVDVGSTWVMVLCPSWCCVPSSVTDLACASIFLLSTCVVCAHMILIPWVKWLRQVGNFVLVFLGWVEDPCLVPYVSCLFFALMCHCWVWNKHIFGVTLFNIFSNTCLIFYPSSCCAAIKALGVGSYCYDWCLSCL